MNSQAIKRIRVRGLFGSYDYSLSAPEQAEQPERLLILYGDNGCGKTTVLRLLFSLLSPDAGRGHKTTVVGIPFKRFEVEFFSGEKVSAWRPAKALTGSYTVKVSLAKGRAKTLKLTPTQEGAIKSDPATESLLDCLRELKISLYLLSDDRSLQFAGLDAPEASAGKGDVAELDALLTQSRVEALKSSRGGQSDPQQQQQVLVHSLKRAEQWIQSQAVRGAAEGDSSVNALYAEIAKRIAHLPINTPVNADKATNQLDARIAKLEERSKHFSQYGLQPEFNGKEIMQIMHGARESHVSVLSTVVTPYVESVERKLDALNGLQTRIHTLVSLVNSFYTSKKMSYTVHDGFVLTAENGRPLRPEMLSSGERHLLLLFCNTIQTLNRPSIFVIDEPEISLNTKWQRRLLKALLQSAAENPVQYIFATHSFEVLAYRKYNTVRMVTGVKNTDGSEANDRGN